MQVVPQRFFKDENVTVFRSGPLSCILHKTVNAPAAGKESYLAVHAISMVIGGRQRVGLPDDEAVVGNDTNAVFLPRGIYTVTDLRAHSRPFECLLFFVDQELIDTFRSSSIVTDSGQISGPITFPLSGALLDFRNGMKNLLTAGHRIPDALIRLKMLELLSLLSLDERYQSIVGQLLSPANRPRLDLLDFMALHFDKPLKVEDYAYLTGRSPASFRRDFRRRFDMSPQQWLTEKRLEKALEILEKGNKSVTGVAMEVGYDNVSWFISQFRRKYAVSPKQYMLDNRNNILA